MRVLICGGREYRDRVQAFEYLDLLHAKHHFTEVIAGAAPGADSIAIEWAVARGVVYREFPANWDKHGIRAGRVRNIQMLNEARPEMVVAFPGGPGTRHMITSSWSHGVPVVSTWLKTWKEDWL